MTLGALSGCYCRRLAFLCDTPGVHGQGMAPVRLMCAS